VVLLDASPVEHGLKWTEGDTAIQFVLTFTDKATGLPIDLSGFTYLASMKRNSWDSISWDMVLDVTNEVNGVIALTPPGNLGLPRRGVWDFKQIDGTSNPKTILSGPTFVRRSVTTVP